MTGAAAERFTPVDKFFEFSLLGLLTSGYFAVLGSGYLDAPTAALTAAALLFRGLMAARLIRLQIPAGAVAVATLAYMAFYPLDYFFISKSFLPATVHLVCFIAVVKILTAATNRDYFLVKLIAFMELLAACVLSSSFNFFVFLALFLLLGVATFMSSEIRRAARKFPIAGGPVRGSGWRLSGVAGTVSLGILVLTAVLFFLLPRTARAALQQLFQHRYHIAGFSNEVTLGEIGEIKKQDTPVMHVKMAAPLERPGALRWRGSALAQFNGHRWFNLPARGEVFRPNSAGELALGQYRDRKGLAYSVHLNEAAPDGALFFAGQPQSLRIDASVVIRTPVEGYRVIRGGSSGLNYSAYSYLDPSSNDPEGGTLEPVKALTPAARQTYLQLPTIDARIWTLTHDATRERETPEGKARLLETYLRTHYGYTLDLPAREPADPLADFLFRRKKGHCEYFASAMTVMLRTLGIPSRMVTGFAGGVYNPVSGWYVVRSSDAHTWVEAYLPHLGWTVFDPTPPDPNPPKVSLFTRLGFYMDAAEVFWQDWILNYNIDRQLLLASRMEQKSRNFRENWFEEFSAAGSEWGSRVLRLGAGYGVAALGAAVAVLLLLRYGRDGLRWWTRVLRWRKLQRGAASRSDATLLYERMLKLLKQRGIEKPAWLTPCEFARAMPDTELLLLVEDITGAYNDLRFGGRAEAAGRMIRLISRLEAQGPGRFKFPISARPAN